ncbi:SDR family NAD(P)-dependent oxidoreductase [Novispirillum sp. DQ9]|uniref:SDR family NAD(P)-dependent oxidoreductase n=1 Tax=Novispirillum sp. DQ9 TaxID=3398612 RepID=UPI003C7A6200
MPDPARPLHGRVAVVTGASRGIGRAVAERLAGAGADVVLTALRDPAALEVLAADIAARHGVRCLGVAGDVADAAAVSALFSTVHKTFKRLDILVNNAGIMDDAPLGMIAADSLDRTLAVNLAGPLLCLQTAARLMRRGGGGAVVNLGSLIGLRGAPGQAAYAAAKAGIVGLTLAAAKELGPAGIRVNAVAPGFIDTDMTARFDEAARAGRIAATPLGRLGTAEDVAAAVLFLASPEASFITGQVLGVDGGMVV